MSSWDESYGGRPPWDIGRPQPEFLKLADEGRVTGKVIDVGCGTGEQAMLFASRGSTVLGVDSSPVAVGLARSKARSRGSTAEFLVWDALDLGSLGREFDAATDCGLFHVFPDDQRRAYVASLASTVKQGGSCFMLCFSELEPTEWGGPRRVSRPEIEAAFSRGWKVRSVVPAKFDTNFHADGGSAWLAWVTRTA